MLEQEQVSTNAVDKPSRCLSVDFNTAYRQIEDRVSHVAFDIEKIGSVLNLNAYGSLCIIGEKGYAQLLINTMRTHYATKKHGGVGEGYSKIIAIDAGNCSDVYQIVLFARQYG